MCRDTDAPCPHCLIFYMLATNDKLSVHIPLLAEFTNRKNKFKKKRLCEFVYPNVVPPETKSKAEKTTKIQNYFSKFELDLAHICI